MKTKFAGALVALGIAIGMTSPASAALIYTPVQTQTVATQATNFFNAPMTFNKFDGTLGTLQEIILSLSGHVEGTAKYESLDASPSTVTLALTASITLSRPGGSSIVQTLPVANVTDSATAYDGVTDFAGTSGNTFSNLSADAVNNATLTSASDLALFTAAVPGDTISLDLTALGNSSGSGAGNLITQFLTNAGGTATVQYVYDNGIQVPEPSILAVFGVGLIGLGAAHRRKRKA